MVQGKIRNNRFLYCLFLLIFNTVFVNEVIPSELVNLSSSSWERKASIEAKSRYSIFLNTYSEYLNKEDKRVSSSGRPLDTKLLNKYENASFFLFQNAIHEKTFRHIAPLANQVLKNNIKVISAANEWESVQIGIWALKDLTDFSFEISELKLQNNSKNASAVKPKVRNYFVYNVYARKKADKEVSADMDIDPEKQKKRRKVFYQEEPVVLMDLPSMDIPAHTAQSIYFDIHVPAKTPPGQYTATVSFNLKGELVKQMTLILDVSPFELDTAQEWSRGAYISKFISEKEVINLLENGHNQVSWWTTGGYSIQLVDGKIKADFSPFARYLNMLDTLGMTGPHVVFLGGESPKLHNRIFSILGRKGIHDGRNQKYRNQFPDNDLSAPFESYLTQTLKQFKNQMAACGHDDLLAVLMDEPDHKPGPERLDWYNTTYSMVENNVPDLLTMGVFYHKGDEKKLSHHHSVWSTNRPSLTLYKACKKAGKKMYTYHGGVRFYDPPGKYRFDIGIIPWVYDAAGSFYWAIWNQSDTKRYLDDIFLPHTFAGRATTIARAPMGADYGPLSTLVHKGFREAVDDARYIKTLEKMILKAKGTPGDQEAEKHDQWLSHIKLTLRKKLYVRGGHVYNHKSFVKWRFPVASLTFKNSLGEKCNLESLETFSVFLREDIRRRIISLQKAMATYQ